MMRHLLLFFVPALALAQVPAPVPSPLPVVSNCGSRPDVTTTQNPSVFVFDSGYTARCGFHVKASQPTELLWDIFVTNGNIPTDNQDNGVAKQNVTGPARVTPNGGPIPDDASCGNPIVSPDGLKIVFECQLSTNVGQDVDPGTGAPGYVLYGCSSIPCTSTNTAIIYSQTLVRTLCTNTPAACAAVTGYDWTTMTMQGGLDPHFFPGNNSKVFWNVAEASGATTPWNTIPQFWGIHAFTIDWSGAAPVLTGTIGRWIPGDWVGFTGALATQCTRFYKASSVQVNPDGTVTMYVQADQVPGLTSIAGCIGTNCTDQCYAINATYRQSGIFSFTMNNAPVGTNWKQIAPTPSQTPRLINGEYYGYYEFPLILTGMDPTAAHPYSTRMLAISNTLSGQYGLFTTLGLPNPENESNKHCDYYVIDTATNSVSLITNADVPGTAWHNAIATGGLSAMAHAGYNPFSRFLVTRQVSVGIPDRVLKVQLDYAGNGALKAVDFTGKVGFSGKVKLP